MMLLLSVEENFRRGWQELDGRNAFSFGFSARVHFLITVQAKAVIIRVTDCD